MSDLSIRRLPRATLLEALNRHRGKGKQKVAVKHVHVREGGQVIVGNVAGGGAGTKSENRLLRISSECTADRHPARQVVIRFSALSIARRREMSAPINAARSWSKTL
jgi:hypothetical protein